MVTECEENYKNEAVAVFKNFLENFDINAKKAQKILIVKNFYTTTLMDEYYIPFILHFPAFRHALYKSFKNIKESYEEDIELQEAFPEFKQVLKETEHFIKNVIICPEVWPIP